MIKLFSLKNEKKDEVKAKNSRRLLAAHVRIQKDMTELNLPRTCTVDFPDPNNLLKFKVVVKPDEGFYKNGRFEFTFNVGTNYPYEPPNVKCEAMIYHPNVDLEGNVCLNVLREDWKPVLTINAIVYGLHYLFLEPNPEDPLNDEAAMILSNDRKMFQEYVSEAMRGGRVGAVTFSNCLID